MGILFWDEKFYSVNDKNEFKHTPDKPIVNASVFSVKMIIANTEPNGEWFPPFVETMH